MNTEEIILKAKKQVAVNAGYTDKLFGTEWDDAMMFTHRRKRQRELYEEVIQLLAGSLNYEIVKQETNTASRG